MDLEEFKADYDWRCAFVEAVEGIYRWSYDDDGNPHPIDDVAEVLFCDPGENDGDDWICIGRMKDGRFFHLVAGCDYTGWDCQAGGTITYHNDPTAAAAELTPYNAMRLGVAHDAFLPPGFVAEQMNDPDFLAMIGDYWESTGDTIKAEVVRKMKPNADRWD